MTCGGVVSTVRWRSSATGEGETRPIRHLFLMTGAVPNTVWIGRCLALDDKGFVKAGSDLSAEDLAAARWPLERAPHLLETSLPGVFVVGDARAGLAKDPLGAERDGTSGRLVDGWSNGGHARSLPMDAVPGPAAPSCPADKHDLSSLHSRAGRRARNASSGRSACAFVQIRHARLIGRA